MSDWLKYHVSIGFNEFYIILDNPIDDSEDVILNFAKKNDVLVNVEVLPPSGCYFDGVSSYDRWQLVKKWRVDNAEEIRKTGLPIVDPLSWRQYQNFPRILESYSKSNEIGWLALFDVDEYIVIQDGGSLEELINSVNSPRIRLLNFNVDMQGWDGVSPVRERKSRWSREGVKSYGKGWENRVKSIVRFDCLMPLVSVHSISKGPFVIIDHEVARLHHYKFPVQDIDISYSVVDETI
ncbi:MAG: glycosyltransferase family 2 protein [Pseudomonadota bacterium]